MCGYTDGMTALPLGDAKDRLSELVADIDSTHQRVTITKHGRPTAVLLSTDDLEALEETLDVLSNRALMEQVEASRAEIARGETIDERGLDVAMRDRRQREQPEQRDT